MPSNKVVVFTDIDGTLIDINTGEYGKNTNELIHTMKENNIPLILVSAKTWVEQNKIREDLGLTDPFIVENGGAIIIPKRYFPYSYLEDIQYPLREIEEQKQKEAEEESQKEIIVVKEREMKHKNGSNIPITMIVIELGKPADQIRAKLAAIRKKHNINFKCVADVSLEELSKIASMPLDYAKRMAKRDYGETILQIERNDIARFVKYAEEDGMRVIHGGRFFDVTIGNDKGKAVNVLRNLFNKYHDDVTFFGIGDSANDASMLNLMDIPILVQRPDGSWFNYERIIIKKNVSHHDDDDVIKVNGIGPKGWENAIYNIILGSK